MTRTIRWGILGCAGIAAKAVIPAIQSSRLGRVEAIASRDPDRATAMAARFGIAKAYGDYEAMLADPDIDAIYNPLPNHLHVPMTIRALEQGKPVLCEKPIALDAAQAMKLAAVQEAVGLPVAEAFMVRHHPQWKKARALIAEGRLGEVRAIQTIFSYYLDDPQNVRNQADIGGGGLFDVGCYAINTARFLFDAEPLRAIALMERDPVFGTDRLTSGLLAFPGGRQLAFTCSTQLALTQKVTVLGTRGRLDIPVPFNAPADEPTVLVLDDGRDLAGGGREEIAIGPVDQYREQADAFAEAVLSGKPLETGLDDAIANMRAIDALFRSAAHGRWEAP
ncbi:Gfo/Idh/MocA family oxidoreductase [Shinella yambaruensis]|uniref:Deoxyfructose oxidoreductase n=1 Tax=Shinella yambaruensis TaxID=415996 RepID=A0ABQ5ZI23_9HYPH|nr:MULTISPECIES: Gfo/Idh/MocA family oxidoreductase [Shinella]MCJ8026683.1 Gfo/Idh/MocA family oxidoreductase [Shinella yambaruensis]MCU7983649.1 Gfo/Idh/MocA family oxidoreductase [Shinella yambaruensis]MCW5711888.1 Gfo/Idh/MocA family oxidoreductase [Shinella sp.]GLR51696.1 deoxyfructose oxidoreductase [Shinella yambaruensis]